MLVNLQEMLAWADKQHCAVGSFNIYNVESLQAVLTASREAKAPVIIAFGEKYDSHMPLEALAEMVKFYVGTSPFPFVLHLDHSKDLQVILRALKAGFTSIMYDASKFPLDENIRKTKEIAKIAHLLHASVEGELGYMNPEDGTEGTAGSPETYTTVEEAVRFSKESDADALAIAIGNAHGIYKGTPHLDLERLQSIHEAGTLPLVLHGSSGIPLELLQKAIKLGIRKININTEVSTQGIQSAREFLQTHTDPNTRFESLTKNAEHAMERVVYDYIRCFTLETKEEN